MGRDPRRNPPIIFQDGVCYSALHWQEQCAAAPLPKLKRRSARLPWSASALATASLAEAELLDENSHRDETGTTGTAALLVRSNPALKPIQRRASGKRSATAVA